MSDRFVQIDLFFKYYMKQICIRIRIHILDNQNQEVTLKTNKHIFGGFRLCRIILQVQDYTVPIYMTVGTYMIM